MPAQNQTSILCGVAVGCTAGLAAYLAVSSSSASVLNVAPSATSVQVASVPSVVPQYRQAAVNVEAPAAVPAADVESAAEFDISAPVQAKSWSAIFAGMLALPVVALGVMMAKQQSKREERQALVSIDDLLSVGKKVAVASAVAGASAGFVDVAGAYPIFAQQGYENPREPTGRIVCANCHLAAKQTEVEMPQAVLPDQVFEAVTKVPLAGGATLSNTVDQSSVVGSVTFAGAQPVEFVQERGVPVSQALIDMVTPSTPDTVFKATIKVPYDLDIKQVGAKGKPADLNVGAVLVLPEGFRLAPEDRIPEKMKEELNGLNFIQYSEAQPNILVVGPVPGKMYSEMHVALLSPDPRVNKNAEFGTQPVYVGGNRGRGQIYPTGEKSNNNIYNVEHAGKIVDISLNEKKRIYTVSIEESNGAVTTEDLPPGAELVAKIGDVVEVGQAITTNPNVGGFGQAETEIVLQDPGRVQAFLFFCFAVLGTQTMLVVKKKQYEQVQLSEMNF